VDDEPLARRRIRSLLATDPEIQIVGECRDGASAVSTLLESKPDLVFLDIQMPEMDGFEVLRNIPAATRPVVIFVTAYDRYALKAFDTHALDYLLKPFKRERFFDAVQRAKYELQRGKTEYSEKVSDLLLKLKGGTQRLVVKSAGRIVVLRFDEIDWVEAAANYVRLHVGEQKHNVRDSIGVFERRLPPGQFVRIHRSLIVNADRIRELQPYDGSEYIVVLRSGKELPLGRSYREHVQRFLQLAD
jgi:two-component system LytT family response regulator